MKWQIPNRNARKMKVRIGSVTFAVKSSPKMSRRFLACAGNTAQSSASKLLLDAGRALGWEYPPEFLSWILYISTKNSLIFRLFPPFILNLSFDFILLLIELTHEITCSGSVCTGLIVTTSLYRWLFSIGLLSTITLSTCMFSRKYPTCNRWTELAQFQA